ncbi:MAG: hypothetical protein HYV67_00790 [Candidatus Taylorbacteria bacterium]|nr:hypothetical protein [Candidatus Taylorbacteria bacterium]
MNFESPQDFNKDNSQAEQAPISPEKETAKKRLLERFNELQDNEYGLKIKAGIRVILEALSQRDGNSNLEMSFDDFLNRRSRDPETGHVDAIGGPKNPDMSEWLRYNAQAVDRLRQIVHDNVIEVGKHITAAEAYDLLK